LEPITQPLTDLTNDCVVNTDDLVILSDQWGQETSADFDNSGAVNVTDLLLLLSSWGS
jgi:hypothetical protein